ncbi:50S ribosomal protein L28 [Candidatus Gracilibacteria bacterium]|nr:50S ribosomal protein L28 [Candidatus Gracilibacteria bacterium]
MARCDMCGKGPSFGHNVSFSKRRTNRMWRPNLQRKKITTTDGQAVQVRICTQCIRTMSKTR